MPLNTKYSYKSLKRQDFTKTNPSLLNNSEIIGSCFYQDRPYTDVFPPNIINVIFTDCNLDNCNIPVGATVNRGTNKHFMEQNDGEYWIVNKSLIPLAPRDGAEFDRCGISKDPANIPVVKLAEPITSTNNPIKIRNAKMEAILSDPVKMAAAIAATSSIH